MQLTIATPQDKQEFMISWIEVNTNVGNFVIQKDHIPMILILAPHKPIIFCTTDGKQETITSAQGILEVTRTETKLFLSN